METTMEQPKLVPLTDKIAAALAKAQSAITSPERNREVEVKTKSGGSYKFKYATLDSIIDHVREPLTKNGLWFTQTLANGDGKYRLVTTLLHESGQSIVSETPLLVQGQGNQEFGSALTYMRRYALTALLGVAADEDDDANSADGNTVTSQKDRAPKSGGKTAAPKTDEADAKLKAESARIKRDIDHCVSVSNLNAYIESEKDTLAKIKEASATAYEFLMERANNKRGMLSQEAA